MAWFGKSNEESPRGPQAATELSCSFCGKSQRQVSKLIAGPEVYICDGCVMLCRDIVEDNIPGETKREIPSPPPALAELRQALDARCVGLEAPKQALLGALGLHLARLQEGAPDLRPPVVMLVGPHGSGKSTLLEAFTGLTRLPANRADVNRLSTTGYVGLDVENLLWELVRQAERDFRLAESGVLILDGLHRITSAAPAPGSPRDVSGEAVQRDLLRITEGMKTEVAGFTTRHPQQPAEPFFCHRLLVVLAASFDGLPRGDRAQRAFLAEQGLLRELLARVDHIVPVPAPDSAQLRAVLTQPEVGLLPRQLAALHALGHEVTVEDSAVEAILEHAQQRDDGAWALHTPIARLTTAAASAEGPLHVDGDTVRGWLS